MGTLVHPHYACPLKSKYLTYGKELKTLLVAIYLQSSSAIFFYFVLLIIKVCLLISFFKDF